MAMLNKSVLGKVSGALGDIVFRQRNGKNYISTRPGKGKHHGDPAQMLIRNRFKVSVQTASTMFINIELKNIWKMHTPPKKNYLNYCVQKTFPATSSNNLENIFSIVPTLGFSVEVNTKIIDQNGVSLQTAPLGNNSGIDPLIETNIFAVGLIFLRDPVDTAVEKYSIINSVSEKQIINLNDPLSFTLPFTGIEKQIYERYQDVKAFVALITLNNEEFPVRFSNSLLIKNE